MHQETDERYQGGYQNSSAPLGEEVPLVSISSSAANDGANMNNSNHSYSMNQSVGSSIASVEEEDLNEADLLARKLTACNDNDDLEKIVLRRSLNIPYQAIGSGEGHGSGRGQNFGFRMGMGSSKSIGARRNGPLFVSKRTKGADRSLLQNLVAMISLAILGLAIIFVLLTISSIVAGPPNEPVGPYKLVEIQEGEDFFNNYIFYDGMDSEGSKGYVNYVSREKAQELSIANVTFETVHSDIYGEEDDSSNKTEGSYPGFHGESSLDAIERVSMESSTKEEEHTGKKEPFVYMSTSPTKEGPRNSVRLEGLRRFNRGLFILDLRHMPAGCATWPAFWLTDEPNWPVNGEIDILEGVNAQTEAKTALHTTNGCDMKDVPLGVKTGTWDTATGVPKKNGDIDMTVREAKDCFVYNPHQWLNQGCVAVDRDGTLGQPLNEKGGGVFVLEWDPINTYIRSWAFTPHSSVPENLRKSLQSANNKDPSNEAIRPDPDTWGLPYAHFPIGKGTNCPSSHFRNMHIIFNMALCGSVAGNRFEMDCPLLSEKYGSCDNYVKANTPEMDEVYWKIRGVYVYEREWERAWVD